MVQSWIYDHLPSPINEIRSQNEYENLLRSLTTKSPVLVINYHVPWSLTSNQFVPTYHMASQNLSDSGQFDFYQINCQHLERVCSMANINDVPFVRAYYGNKSKFVRVPIHHNQVERVGDLTQSLRDTLTKVGKPVNKPKVSENVC